MDEELISKKEENIEDLVKNIRLKAEKAKTEEDIKMAIEKIFANYLPSKGIKIDPKYEVTLLKGRADAVYRRVIIDYKKPHTLEQENVKNDVIKKIKDYIQSITKGKISRKFVGIALDGFNIIFIRPPRQILKMKEKKPKTQLTLDGTLNNSKTIEENWKISKVLPVNKETMERLFLYFRSLSFKILSPENLAYDFGHKSKIANEVIGIFNEKLTKIQHPKIEALYIEWKRIFGIIYGEEISKAKNYLKELADFYGFQTEDLRKLLFSIHSYYALLMKMMAAEVLSLQTGSYFRSLVSEISLISTLDLKDKMRDLEEKGGFFKRYGISNFLEGDFFGWYINCYDEDIANCIKKIAKCLSRYEPATTSLEPEYTKDLLKKLYQYLLPNELRRALGEFYTPDWLAEHLLDRVGYQGEIKKRILDPACGSGTFLSKIIAKIKGVVEDSPEIYNDKRIVLNSILENVIGFDINPLAVISSRTNYILALGGDLIRYRSGDIEIPVYQCDSILISRKYSVLYGKRHKIKTSIGDFYFPSELAEKKYIEKIVSKLEENIPKKIDLEIFLDSVKNDLPQEIYELCISDLSNLYKELIKLEKQNKDEIWARIIKNSFAPLFVGKFDYVIGNPPWIRWGLLSKDYRSATLEMWKDYGLFSLKGMEARLGSGEKDLSMLFTYACTDFYLKDGGTLGFLITQEVIKAKGAGEGFRKFRLGEKGKPLKVIEFQDLVTIQPFEGASNKTGMIILQKGRPTEYPIRYILWDKKETVHPDASLSEIFHITDRKKLIAQPVGNKNTDQWLTIEKKFVSIISKMRGKSFYKAIRGASIEPYGVYYLEIVLVRPDGLLIIKNLPELGRKKIKKVEEVIEPDLVFPALRGRDIKRWGHDIDVYTIISQDPEKREGYDEKWMNTNLPKTYNYLLGFKEDLLKRKGYWKYFSKKIKSKKKLSDSELKKKYGNYRYIGKRTKKVGDSYHVYQVNDSAFYTMFNISNDSFAPYRVVWKRMSNDLTATVISTTNTPYGKKPIIPTDTTALLPFKEKDEAYYVCALLNSTLSSFYIRAFSSAGRGFGAPSILKFVKIPQYDNKNTNHKKLADLSKLAHKQVKENKLDKLKKTEIEIDDITRQIWNISKVELGKILKS